MFGDLLNKIGNTDDKWTKEKLSQSLRTFIWLYRNSNMKVPKTAAMDKIMELVERTDPSKTMSDLEVARAIINNPPDVEEVIKIFKQGEVVNDSVIDKYAEEWYQVFRKVLSSPDASAWDAAEFQGQQMASIITIKQAERLFKKVQEIANSDPTCPFLLKKMVLQFFTTPAEAKTPTEDDEKTAEEIIGLIKPGLKDKDIDIYRALVDSLKWRGKKELERTLKAVTKTPKERRKIRGRESCIFIESDEGVHYVG